MRSPWESQGSAVASAAASDGACHPFLAHPQALQVIRQQVWRHTCAADLAADERDDLVHDLWLFARRRFAGYDPAKGASPPAFLALIVRDGVRTWLRDRDRRCRSPRRLCSFDELAPEDPDREPPDIAGGLVPQQRALRADLVSVLAQCCEDARRLVASLAASEHDLGRARRALGWSRGRFAAAREDVRQACQAGDLVPGARP